MAAISHTYKLSSYSTPELRGLFNDWLTEIEHMVVDFVNSRHRAHPAEIAAHLHIERESVIFILSKLTREKKISIQASGTAVTNKGGKRQAIIQQLRRKR